MGKSAKAAAAGSARKSGKRKGSSVDDDAAGLAAVAATKTIKPEDVDMDDDDDDDDDDGGKSLGERVRALQRSRSPDATTTATDPTHDSAEAAARVTATERAIAEALGGGRAAPPKADSLATLLSQALVADDRVLIERCLNVSDPSTVSNTVARLQPGTAIKLLTASLDRMRTKPSRGEQLARWMRTVLLHHAAFIASSAKAQRAVLELMQTVEAHVAMQRPLLALMGRLDLLLHKQRKGGEGEDDDAEDEGARGPLSVYTEGEEDVEEVIDADDDDDDDGAESLSDEWETDDGEDDDDLDDDDDDDDDDDMED